MLPGQDVEVISHGIEIRRMGVLDGRRADAWAVFVQGREQQPWLTKREAKKLARALRLPNPSMMLQHWQKPILWDATALEAELGAVPPAAVLLAAMQAPITVPVLARVPGNRGRVYAGIEIEAQVEREGGSIPAWGTEEVAMLLAHHSPDIVARPTGRKWNSWREAAPQLLSLVLEHGTRHTGYTEDDPVTILLDDHTSRPEHRFEGESMGWHGSIRFLSWTVSLERPRRKNPVEGCRTCFAYAADESHRSGAVVVHGVITDPCGRQRLTHAWVEQDGYARDGHGRHMPSADYYAELQASDMKHYAPAQVVVLRLREGHPGPWEGEPAPTGRQAPPPRLSAAPGLASAKPKAPRAPSKPRGPSEATLLRKIKEANRQGDVEEARDLSAQLAALRDRPSRRRKAR
jgi:hypothetical protein